MNDHPSSPRRSVTINVLPQSPDAWIWITIGAVLISLNLLPWLAVRENKSGAAPQSVEAPAASPHR